MTNVAIVVGLVALIAALSIVTLKIDEFAKRQDQYEKNQQGVNELVFCVLHHKCELKEELVFEKNR